MGRFFLETFGCQMNRLDSELVRGALERAGLQPTDRAVEADLILFNTCAVRQHAEDKVYSRLGEVRRLKASRPDLIVGVIGCMAEHDAEAIIRRMPHVDLLCGPSHLHLLTVLVEQVRASRRRAIALAGKYSSLNTALPEADWSGRLEDLDLSRPVDGRENHFQAYIRISRGCNKFCTFCVVPYTRGREVHRPPEEIITEAKRLADAGVVEITLLGQTVNHYFYDYGDGRRVTFADLLKMVHDAVPSVRRIRFVTSYPRDFTDDALRVMAECERICPYLHIPAQSGSNAVLKRMNRGYTVEQYKDLIDRAREIVPDISIAGDMIVGFCGETEADFEASMDLLRYVRYKNCFIFKYSPRPGTMAYSRLADDVPEDVKRRRHWEMLQLQNSISLENNQRLVGHTVEVLVEGPSKAALKKPDLAGPDGEMQLTGRTVGDQIVVFPGRRDLTGQFVRVRITAATAVTLHGELTDSGAG